MKLWQKNQAPHQKIDHFTVGKDREYDLYLAAYDCQASIAHAQMLSEIGILSQAESNQLVSVLEDLKNDAKNGDFVIETEFEDMHSKIEYVLTQKLGDLGKKIHTARSRNDQVLVALHLYLKAEIETIKGLAHSFFELLMDLAEQHKNHFLPGYTHFQVAMPSSFGLWFSAYAETLVDDIMLLNGAYQIVDQNPLGSAAGFGSSFPIDRKYTTKSMGFGDLKYNVIAAQMSRGKAEKTTATAMASLAATLSKLAMDLCLYMGQEHNFVSFPEALTTGSSIMPHKKNPDVFELIRGKCNLLQGLPNQLALLMTNLPSGYHREMQLAKGPIIEAIENLKACLDLFTFSLKEIQVRENILEDPKYQYVFSVDTLNEWVKGGMPFRDAYKKMGEAIASGDYQSHKNLSHTHLGSIGNLALEAIRSKMEKASNQ
ncbi:MAG: argininosuccinate lyase [Flavobacteriaceae bacterium TMED42]|nr:MAG: argininosuccinate lyase [Flavobacteriaceae bacterium TMED42]